MRKDVLLTDVVQPGDLAVNVVVTQPLPDGGFTYGTTPDHEDAHTRVILFQRESGEVEDGSRDTNVLELGTVVLDRGYVSTQYRRMHRRIPGSLTARNITRLGDLASIQEGNSTFTAMGNGVPLEVTVNRSGNLVQLTSVRRAPKA